MQYTREIDREIAKLQGIDCGLHYERHNGVVNRYTNEFKECAVTLANKIGVHRASLEINVPSTTLFQWCNKNKNKIMSDELNRLKQENKMLKNLIKHYENIVNVMSK